MRFVDGNDLCTRSHARARWALSAPSDRQPGRRCARRRPPPRPRPPRRQARQRPAHRRGRREHAYLTDFGLVKTLTGDIPGTTTAGHFIGTLDSSSPRRSRARMPTPAPTSTRSPASSTSRSAHGPFLRDSNVGTMFAHVNEPPPALLEANPKLPPALDPVVEKALAKNPDERHQTAGEFARAAQEALAAAAPPGDPAPAAPAATPATTARRAATARSGSSCPPVLVLGLIAAGLAAAGVFKTGDEGGGAQPAPRRPTPQATATATADATARPSHHPQGRRLDPHRQGPRRHLGHRRRQGLRHRRQRGRFIRIDPKANKRSASRSTSARRPTASPAPRGSRGSPPRATTRSAASRATPTRS